MVGQAESSAEYNDAMAALTVWIIGSGPPIPIESMGLGPATTAPLPEGACHLLPATYCVLLTACYLLFAAA